MEHKQHSSTFEVLTYILFRCHRYIDFCFFLSCYEKAHDNTKFSCENSKPHHESWIMTH